MSNFKVGDFVGVKQERLMQGDEPGFGVIIADGANLKYYTPEECAKLGYEYPRVGWWSVLWSRGIDAGSVSDASEGYIEKVNYFKESS